MTDTSLSTIPPAAMPALTIEQALQRRQQQSEFIQKLLRKGTDYGEIPGTGRKAATDVQPGAIRNDNSTLLKPGAEKLLMFFGLRPRFEAIQTIEDWTGKNYDGEPFFYYHQKCILYRDGEIMAEGDGSCNSRESKYRYRKGERLCPKCQQPNIRKSKDGGWYCWAKTGGCGATFRDGDQAIEGQQTARVLNADIADQANTILKMAQKRALVAATLIGVNASEYFTQDVEDLPHPESTEAEVRVIHPAPQKATPKAATTPSEPIDATFTEAEAVKPAPLGHPEDGPSKGDMMTSLRTLAGEWYDKEPGIKLNNHLKRECGVHLGELSPAQLSEQIAVFQARLAERKQGVAA